MSKILLNTYASDGLYKMDDLLPFLGFRFPKNLGFVLEDTPYLSSAPDHTIWVPRVPQIAYRFLVAGNFYQGTGFKDSMEANNSKIGRSRRDESFMVPHMNLPSKRLRSIKII